MPRSVRRLIRFPLAAATLLLFLGSCVAESGPTAPEFDPQAMEARGGNGGGGGGGGGGGSITVTGTEPGELPRGALGVGLTIRGSGFEPGADVDFALDGVDTDRITVLDVTYVDESTLFATVDVADDADETFYDVIVRQGPKKKGVGIDLLRVSEPDVVPAIDPQVLSAEFTGDYQAVNEMAGAWMVGDDDLCDFVYNVDTGVKTCLDVPWSTPNDYSTVLLVGVDPAGVVVGWGEDASEYPIPFRVDVATAPDEFVPLEIPAGWDQAKPEWDRSINAQGLIVGTARRDVVPEKGPKHRTSREYAMVLWGPDGSVHSMSAVGDFLPDGGLSDLLPDGTLRVGVSGDRIWDGVDGSVPVEVNTATLADPNVSVIAPDGTIYGTDQDRMVRWSDPASPASLLVRLRAEQGLSVFALDEHGNLLGRGRNTQVGVFGVCVSLADPTTGVTALAPYAGSEDRLYTAPMGGRGGIVYGHSADKISFWDMRGVQGGCETS